jgi:hypothetical protein
MNLYDFYHRSLHNVTCWFPWRRDIGALSRNNAEYTIVPYATMYIGRFATVKMDYGHCWQVTLLRCANVSMVTRFVVYGVGLICRAVRVWKSPRVDVRVCLATDSFWLED